MMRVQLIDNAGDWLKMLSVQAQLLGSALVGAWMIMPEEWKATISPKVMATTALVCFGAGIIGRLVKQSSLHADDVPEPTRPQEPQ
jgi:hypothetical protein